VGTGTGRTRALELAEQGRWNWQNKGAGTDRTRALELAELGRWNWQNKGAGTGRTRALELAEQGRWNWQNKDTAHSASFIFAVTFVRNILCGICVEMRAVIAVWVRVQLKSMATDFRRNARNKISRKSKHLLFSCYQMCLITQCVRLQHPVKRTDIGRWQQVVRQRFRWLSCYYIIHYLEISNFCVVTKCTVSRGNAMSRSCQSRASDTKAN
jgi:hypothetical protein